MTALWTYLVTNLAQIAEWTAATVVLAVVPLVAGIVVSLPIGWLVARYRGVAIPVAPAAKVLYTIPSLVMFLVLPGILGTRILDPVNVAVALVLYTLALLIPAAADAFRNVPDELLDAGSAMGQSAWQRFWSLQLPLSIPVFTASVRVAAVSNVALISVASVIGVSQLGQLFVIGNNLGNLSPIVLGLIAFIALALLLDAALLLASRALTPWQRGVSA